MKKHWLLLLSAMAAGAGCAQTVARPDPAAADGKAPAPEYRSAFEGYRRYAEPEVAGWREMNQEVGRVGGHPGIVRGQGDATKPGAKAHGEHK